MVRVEHITFSYGRASGVVLNDISFEISDGTCVAILGNNGAGKSTLLKCIDGIHPCKSGTVTIDEKNVFAMSSRKMAQHIAYVQQNAASTEMTVFDTVLLGRKPYMQWDASQEDRRIAGEIIHEMGLDSYALRKVSQLSGGEAQKVMLARALAQKPKLLLLDEPTSNLDPRNQHEVLRLVRSIARTNHICVAIIIHDLNLAARYCDEFLFLKDARVYAHGGSEAFTPETIAAVYGMEVNLLQWGTIPVVLPYPDDAGASPKERTNEMKKQGRNER